MTTTLYKYKCLNCSLHYVVATWHPAEWKDRKPFCPECGKNDRYVAYVETVDKQIFEIVPGMDAVLIGAMLP